MVELKSTPYAKLNRVQRIARAAMRSNPYIDPVLANPPTVTLTATADATLTNTMAFATGNVLHPQINSTIAWYNGVPTANNGTFIAMPVASFGTGNTTGNLSGFANGGVTADMNQWSPALEVETDADTIELKIYTGADKVIMVQVDGQYVDKVGWAGPTTNATAYLNIKFGSRKVRRIRFMWANSQPLASAPALPISLSVKPTFSFWKPAMSQVIKFGYVGHSFVEAYAAPATAGAPFAMTIPNASSALITGELLGFRDTRQHGVGQSGYLSTGGRLKAIDQIPYWSGQGPHDVLAFRYLYNDYAFTPSQVAAAMAPYVAAVRAVEPDTPLIFLGCDTGIRNNDAQTIALENASRTALLALNDPLLAFIPIATAAQPYIYGTGYGNGHTNGSGNSDLYVSGDATHYDVPGHEYDAYRVADDIRDCLFAMGP